ncbi:MAG: hypothetical protein JWL64_2746 [Frankiales bacterium]|nr:hypothetical protein [Frankiales bacterium]
MTGLTDSGATAGLSGLVPVRFARTPRRWPWALAAAAAGAAAGAGAVLVVRRVLGEDQPDAQDPAELRAVIDPGPPVAAPAAPVERADPDEQADPGQ